MGFLKWANKTGYSVIQVNEFEGKIYKTVNFEFENLNFGNFNGAIKKETKLKEKYIILVDIYRELVRMGIYPPRTKFHVKGSFDEPTLFVEMPKLIEEVETIPIRKIALLEKFISLNPLFVDVYSPHNYRNYNGEIYYIDIEIFPKL